MSLIHDAPSSTYSRHLRWLIYFLWFVILLGEPLWYVASFPPSMIRPLGALALLPESVRDFIFSRPFLLTLGVIGPALVLLSLPEKTTRYVMPFSCLAIWLHQVILRSYTHSGHAELSLLLAAFIYAIGAWVKSPDGKDVRPFLVATSLTLTYMIIGIFRLAAGQLEIFTSDTILVWVLGRTEESALFETGFGRIVWEFPEVLPLLQTGLVFATAMEILAPFCVVSRRLRFILVPLIISMHIGIALLMNIFFFENSLLLAYLFLVPDRGDPAPSKGE